MTTTPTQTVTGTYEIDPAHSRIGFVARHAMVTKVRGSFNEFAGSGYFDIDNPEATHLELVIQAASVDTRNEDRDNHLRSNDFFDMENHPTIEFRSTSVERTGDVEYRVKRVPNVKVVNVEYRVTGDLTMRGVTRSVSVDFTYEGSAKDPFGASRIGFEGSTKVNRKDWGIEFNAPLETGGVLVGEQVTLEFEVSAVAADA